MTYKKNFLTQVIARIDFASPIEEFNKKVPKRFDTEALNLFPIKEAPHTTIEGILTISKNGSKIKEEKSNKLWLYHDRKKEKKLELVPTHFDIVINKYKNYEDIKTNFVGLIDVITEEVSDVVIKRFGLRFINNIDIRDKTASTKWENYLNKNLLSIFKIPGKKDVILRAFHNLVFKYDNIFLIFKYGMYNPDFPAQIKKKVFILDYDAYYEGLLDPKDVPKYMDSFHKRIYTLFEDCIIDEVRKKMGIINEKKKTS